MKQKLHYFNPGHEAAVQKGYPNYTPPANLQRMIRELSSLPLWYGDANEYVWVDDPDFPSFLASLPKEIDPLVCALTVEVLHTNKTTLPEFIAAPWGLSPQSIRMYEDLVSKYALLVDIPPWKGEYVELTGRQTAAACLQRIGELLPEMTMPQSPVFFRNLDDLEHYLLSDAGRHIVKAPYSSSGRGLVWLKENTLDAKDTSCVRGMLKRQGCVSVERWIDKVHDFAIEFYSDGKGTLFYKGLSLFDTAQRGAYSGNILKAQATLEAEIASKIGKKRYEQVIAAVQQAIKERYAARYCGYLGVDMMLYNHPQGFLSVHPCIEINMRYTMGMVAITLFEKYMHPSATGVFTVTYESEPGEAYQKHLAMKAANPLTFQNQRIQTGYLSLCPVTTQTHYRAYILLV